MKPTSATASVGKQLPGVIAAFVVMLAGFWLADRIGQQILDFQGLSGSSPLSGVPVAIDRARPIERAIAGDGEEGVQLGILRVDARERLLAEFDGRNAARADGISNLPRGLKGKLTHD